MYQFLTTVLAVLVVLVVVLLVNTAFLEHKLNQRPEPEHAAPVVQTFRGTGPVARQLGFSPISVDRQVFSNCTDRQWRFSDDCSVNRPSKSREKAQSYFSDL